jgi:hypothetical protein
MEAGWFVASGSGMSKLLRNVLGINSIEVSSVGFTFQNAATGFFGLHGTRQG